MVPPVPGSVAYEAGELEPEQARWFQPAGEEQLYDLQSDPHELVNLAGLPGHASTQRRLAAALEDWRRRVGDTSDVPESELRNRLLENGQQPVTPPPTLRLEGQRVHINASSGASIEYRLDEQAWQLYTQSVEVSDGVSVQARAVRYGWQGSEVVSMRGQR